MAKTTAAAWERSPPTRGSHRQAHVKAKTPFQDGHSPYYDPSSPRSYCQVEQKVRTTEPSRAQLQPAPPVVLPDLGLRCPFSFINAEPWTQRTATGSAFQERDPKQATREEVGGEVVTVSLSLLF